MRATRSAVGLFLCLLLFRFMFAHAQQPPQTLPDGLLGLTQTEIRTKFGPPTEIRVYDFRLSKEQVFTLQEWEAVGARIYGVGKDVFYLKPNDVELRYSFYYHVDKSQSAFHPRLVCTSYTIEFDKPISLKDLTTQIPQLARIDLKPAKCYAASLWELKCILPSHSELARTIRLLALSKPRFGQWNIGISLRTTESNPTAFRPETLFRELTISTGSIEEADVLVGRYGARAVANPF